MTVFGTTKTGQEVRQVTISNETLTATILTYGAIVHDIRLAGTPHNLTLNSDRLSDYEDTMGYFGAIVGPIANRISTSRLRLDGMMYELERNENGAVHLHSGTQGVHAKVWTISDHTTQSVTLSLHMADGDAGLPGARDIAVTYRIAAPATLTMTIEGTTDATTCMNFASHIYWNLDGSDSWQGHRLQIAADHYLPVDDATCPTGDIADVTGTLMDFRQAKAPEPTAPALDHNFCLSTERTALRDVLWLTGASGLTMTLATTEPGMQIHDAAGSHRPGRLPYEGLLIEPQGWPDAPNHRGFPSIKVTPDAAYTQVTSWQFSDAAIND